LAEITGCRIPESWPDRELRPVSGISLKPIFDGGSIGKRPPIHLLFSTDRGLRDGDWKLVSFRGGAWELFHVPTDRTETNNVAAGHPDVVKRMIKKWHEMAEQVLHAPEKSRKPVSSSSTKVHPEWTNFSKAPGEGRRPSKRTRAIRSRIDTRLVVEKGQLVLHCGGKDSGIAIDRLDLPGESKGPYQLKFRLQSQAGGAGEVFFTTDAKTTLPKGSHVLFDVSHDGQWHEYTIELKTTKRIHALRFDPCSSPGVVRVDSLRISDAQGMVLSRWPAASSNTR